MPIKGDLIGAIGRARQCLNQAARVGRQCAAVAAVEGVDFKKTEVLRLSGAAGVGKSGQRHTHSRHLLENVRDAGQEVRKQRAGISHQFIVVVNDIDVRDGIAKMAGEWPGRNLGRAGGQAVKMLGQLEH